MPVYKLTIEYDGTGFSGWQEQPGQRTVQGVLKEALATVLRHPVALQGASRTDAGVHAFGQAASFVSEVKMEPQRLVKGLSALCRPDVAVVDAQVVADDFNARFASEGKHYEYRLLNRTAPSPLLGNTSWHLPRKLDFEAMGDAAKFIVGTHDFAGFRAADCGRVNTVRTLTGVTVGHGDRGLVVITVKGTAFLKYMVRIIAGTLAEIGLGKLATDTPTRVFESGDRTLAGQTAPAHGLTLVEVYYSRDSAKKKAADESTTPCHSGP